MGAVELPGLGWKSKNRWERQEFSSDPTGAQIVFLQALVGGSCSCRWRWREVGLGSGQPQKGLGAQEEL